MSITKLSITKQVGFDVSKMEEILRDINEDSEQIITDIGLKLATDFP
jgi:Ni2+-binding GTPase involved in maturation of urease and hydrogenase